VGNEKEGEKFLAGNAKREGVVTTRSALQYEVRVAFEGTGRFPVSLEIVALTADVLKVRKPQPPAPAR
jgi:FKBP-type peptidyl-prolyl cis-trans isomerase